MTGAPEGRLGVREVEVGSAWSRGSRTSILCFRVLCDVGTHAGRRQRRAHTDTMAPKDEKERILSSGWTNTSTHKPALGSALGDTKQLNGFSKPQ